MELVDQFGTPTVGATSPNNLICNHIIHEFLKKVNGIPKLSVIYIVYAKK